MLYHVTKSWESFAASHSDVHRATRTSEKQQKPNSLLNNFKCTDSSHSLKTQNIIPIHHPFCQSFSSSMQAPKLMIDL